ncbi:MAG: amidohydrolase, partial [Gemmatimonadetes bacterium]|nr:amidohydrolase [Gemmatimonadota bacterium]
MVSRFFPTLKRVAGDAGASEGGVTMAGEDFSRFSELAPGFFFNLSVTPPHLDLKTVASNHSPLFQADDRALPIGVRAMTNMAMDFLRSGGLPKPVP